MCSISYNGMLNYLLRLLHEYSVSTLDGLGFRVYKPSKVLTEYSCLIFWERAAFTCLLPCTNYHIWVLGLNLLHWE